MFVSTLIYPYVAENQIHGASSCTYKRVSKNCTLQFFLKSKRGIMEYVEIKKFQILDFLKSRQTHRMCIQFFNKFNVHTIFEGMSFCQTKCCSIRLTS